MDPARRRALPLLAFALAARPASAQAPPAAWPNRPLRFVVPFAAGSPVEVPARFLAEHLTPRLGQPVVVESRPGAGGALGAQAVIAANDGHSFLFGTSAIAIQPAVQPEIGYDPLRDLVPVSLVSESPMTFVVRPGGRIRDLPGLIALARREPGRVTYGTSGSGTTTHMVGALFALRAGIEMTQVPYRGSGQLIGAFLAGDVDVMVGEGSTALPHAREGRALIVAQTGEARSPAMPEVPTLPEVVPGTVLPIWFALLGNRATPPEAVARLTREIAPLRDPAGPLARRMAEGGATLLLTGPEALAERLRREMPLWREVVRETGIRVQ